LPNGIELPAGTKQTVVHPYPHDHPLASHFTVQAFREAMQAKESLQIA
jgi:hypothetical protein